MKLDALIPLRLLRRLWAGLMVACAISLLVCSMADAAEIGVDLNALSQRVNAVAVSDSQQVDPEGQTQKKKTLDDCAVCCVHCGTCHPTGLDRLSFDLSAVKMALPGPDAFWAASIAPPDQPPRA